MGNNFLQKAIDPYQYDSFEVDWEREGFEDSPIRRFFRVALKEQLEDLRGKSVIDIGSGLGNLFSFLKEQGVGTVEGIEPSKKNVEFSKRLHPHVPVFQGTLKEYPASKKFDVSIAVMVFEHIHDLDTAFRKIEDILKSNGSFYLIAANKDYFTTPRFNYQLATQEIGDGVVVCRVTREYGTLYDIVRPASHFMKAAHGAGFELRKRIGLMPTKELIEAAPKYAQFETVPINNLFVFGTT